MKTGHLQIIACMLLTASSTVMANCDGQTTHCETTGLVFDSSHLSREYALGIRRFDAQDPHRLTGWQLNDHWYLGHERRGISDFGFVRRGNRSDFAVGNKGIEIRLKF